MAASFKRETDWGWLALTNAYVKVITYTRRL